MLLRLFSISDPVPAAWDYNDPAPIVDCVIYEYEIVTNRYQSDTWY
jgi:hypothetical protein